MSNLRTHLVRELPAGDALALTVCAREVARAQATTTRGHVTCARCTRALRVSGPDADTYAGTARSFYAATREPWNLEAFREALSEIADVVAWERDEQVPYKRHPEPRTHRWADPVAALRDLVRIRADGYSQGSVHDPRAIARKLGHEGVSYAQPGHGRALDMAEDLVHVSAAFERAFATPATSSLDDHTCRLVTMLRWVGGKRTGEIAEFLAERGLPAVDAKHVGRVARHGRTAVYAFLRSRDLVPRNDEDEERLALTRRAEDPMGRPHPKATRNDLHGWKEIAEFLGIDESTARRWADKLGLPVVRVIGAIEASSVAVAGWRKQQESARERERGAA